jgi:hypothetical protein
MLKEAMQNFELGINFLASGPYCCTLNKKGAIARKIVENLETALEAFREIAADLKDRA